MRLFFWGFILRNHFFFPEDFVDDIPRVPLWCQDKVHCLSLFITYTTKQLFARLLNNPKVALNLRLLTSVFP